jgi:hypothetical protein
MNCSHYQLSSKNKTRKKVTETTAVKTATSTQYDLPTWTENTSTISMNLQEVLAERKLTRNHT